MLLAIAASALALLVHFAFVGSPERRNQCGSGIDDVISNTVDAWLGFDTLTTPGLRPWEFPAFALFDALVSPPEPCSGTPARVPPEPEASPESSPSSSRQKPRESWVDTAMGT